MKLVNKMKKATTKNTVQSCTDAKSKIVHRRKIDTLNTTNHINKWQCPQVFLKDKQCLLH